MMRRRAAILAFALIAAALACNVPSAQEQAGQTASPSGIGKPLVAISSPAADFKGTVGQTLQVQSLSTDDIGVTRVEMLVDGVVVRSDTAPDPSGQKSLALLQNWTPGQPGPHKITLIAYRADGTASDPANLTITVGAAAGGAALTPTSGPCMAQATTDLNVRSGPSTAYPIVGVLGVGKADEIVGRNGSGSWYQIAFYIGVEGRGWVSAAYVTTSGNCTDVPQATYGPPPSLTPTPTLTPSPTSTPSLADLVVTNIAMPTSIFMIDKKAPVTITVTVVNIGGVIATGFKVVLYPTGVGGPGGMIDLGTVASLHPGESVDLDADFTYTIVGAYNVVATADPGHKVTESDRDNNTFTQPILVAVPTTPTSTSQP